MADVQGANSIGGDGAVVPVADDDGETHKAAAVVVVDTTGAAVAPASQSSMAAAAASLAVIDDWDESDRAKANIIVGQAGVSAGAGAVAANTPRVTLASDDPLVAAAKSATATHTSVNSAAASTEILAANASRKGARIRNSDANLLHLDLSGGTATVDQAHVSLAQNESYAVDAGYTGAITGIWAADGSGVASVVEFT